MDRRSRFAFALAVVLTTGLVFGAEAPYQWAGLPAEPPRPQLPAASAPASVPPPAGAGRVFPLRMRFYHDRDVQVLGAALVSLFGAWAMVRRSMACSRVS